MSSFIKFRLVGVELRTDGLDEFNSRFSQYCDSFFFKANKYVRCIYNRETCFTIQSCRLLDRLFLFDTSDVQMIVLYYSTPSVNQNTLYI